MTNYRLKDRKLQKKLDELSHGAFSEMLKDMGCLLATKNTTQMELGDSRFTVTLHKEDFEVVPEFNPDDWNKWPDVTPPSNVPMRLEVYSKRENTDTPEPRGGDCIIKGCARWDGYRWISNGWEFCLDDSEENGLVRYRPWE